MSRLVLLTVLATGCAKPVYELEASGDAGSTSGAAPGSMSTTGEPDPQLPGSSESTGESGDEGNPNFLIEPDGGGTMMECDQFKQDCPPGEKCMPWANDGGSSWNATRCSPIAPDPDDVGEPCMVEGSGVSGVDSCVYGAMCWDVDPETNMGTCVAFCVGDDAEPMCEDPTTLCVGRSPLTLCLPSCCPLEQDCLEGQACYPFIDDFMCAPDASGPDLGGFGDPCEYLNVCDPGLFCASADAVPDCGGSIGCCSVYCYVGFSTCDAFDPAMECVPWFEEGEAPPGTGHVGACMVPE